jgi:hypothetical protein
MRAREAVPKKIPAKSREDDCDDEKQELEAGETEEQHRPTLHAGPSRGRRPN